MVTFTNFFLCVDMNNVHGSDLSEGIVISGDERDIFTALLGCVPEQFCYN